MSAIVAASADSVASAATTDAGAAATVPFVPACNIDDIEYRGYTDESMLREIQVLVATDLSEPYSVFTYRYFLHQWPNLCICAYDGSKKDEKDGNSMIATFVCKAEDEGEGMVGYIAMLTVDKRYRKMGIAQTLVNRGIDKMIEAGCESIMLETEASNLAALNLYLKLGFVKEEKLSKYYLNGGDAYRLRLNIDKVEEQEA
jgi:peptide alpha-N-acetyltransferase